MSAIIPYTGSALVKSNGKWISSRRGGYVAQATEDYIKINPDSLITPREIALIHFTSNTLGWSEAYCRSRIWIAVENLLKEGIMVYTGYDWAQWGKILWVKHYKGDKTDDEYLDIYLDRAQLKADGSADKIRLIRSVLKTAKAAIKAR